MKFTKATIPSEIPFGVYRVDHAYIYSLKNADDNIVDPVENNRYCGPVFSANSERGPVAFFAPISPDYETKTGFLGSFTNGIYANLIDFNKMIPCVDTKFIILDKSNENLAEFCNNLKDDLLDCGNKMMLQKYPDME